MRSCDNLDFRDIPIVLVERSECVCELIDIYHCQQKDMVVGLGVINPERPTEFDNHCVFASFK